MGKAVDKTIELTTESQKLARTLGISATQASYLKMAIGDVYGTTDEYVKLVNGFDRNLKANEKAMQELGIQTRDSNGDLRNQQDLIMESLEKLRGYKEGTDRNIAATQMFGEGVKVSNEMLALNAEKLEQAKEKSEALGLAVGADNVEASNRFRAAMNDMQDICDAVKNSIGQALLPVLNDLAEWFSEYGPQAILAIKVAIGIVTSLFYGLAYAAKALWAVCTMAFKNIMEVGGAMAEMFKRVLAGDFAGALGVAGKAMSETQTNVGEMFDKIMAGAVSTRESLGKIWEPLVNGPQTKDSGKATDGTEDADLNNNKKKGDNGAAARRAAAEAERLKRQQWQVIEQGYRGEEQAAKDNLQKLLEIQKRELESAKQMWGDKSAQAIAAANKIADTQRKLLEQEKQLNDIRAESSRKVSLLEIDDAEASAEARYQMEQMTAEQLIALKMQYEQQRYEINSQALMDEAQANVDRVIDHEQTLAAIDELDATHRSKVAELNLQSRMEEKQAQQQAQQVLAQGFQNAIMNMIRGCMTFKQAMKSMFAEILQGFVQMLVQWAARWLAHLVFERVTHAASEATKKKIAAKSTADSIKNAVSVAGANGVASWAAAPWPINIGAPGFGAAMAGAAGSFGAALAAEQGFDVPAGVNPVTQLHQKEMVLPAEHADVIRGIAARGNQSDSVGPGMVQIAAHDVRGFQDYLRRNPSALAEGVRYAARRGHTGVIEL